MLKQGNVLHILLDASDMKLAYAMTEKALIGGHSHIRSNNERSGTLYEDNLIGQIGQIAGTKYFTGDTKLYELSRWYQNKMPTTGDGGSDIPGTNIDFKTSLMRYGPDVSKYRLIVRPAERHNAWVYVPLFVAGYGENGARVVMPGWANDSDLPKYPESSGVFNGAYVLPVSSLNPLPPVRWSWLT